MADLRKAAEQAVEAIMHGGAKEQAAAVHELRQALAQPKQEPLVWMNKYGHVASFKNDEYKDPLYAEPLYNPKEKNT